MNLHKKIHNYLIQQINKYGQTFPKKHGMWVRLSLKSDVFLALDTWNRALTFCRGSGVYNYWTGFAWTDRAQIGSDFGYYRSYMTLDQIYALRADVEKAIFMQEKWRGFKDDIHN